MERVRVRAATGRVQPTPWYAIFPVLLPMALAILGMAGLLLLVQSSGITSAAYEVLRLEQIRSEWERSNFQLEADTAALQSLSRVEKEAVGRLKMVPADRPLFVPVKRSSAEPLRPLTARPRADDRPASESPDSAWQQIVVWLRAWF